MIVTPRNLPGLLMEYEVGNLSEEAVLQLFAYMIKEGTVWRLQGSYGRTAQRLISSGQINTKGEIKQDVE